MSADALAIARRRTRVVRRGGAAAVLLAGVFAAWPLPPAALPEAPTAAPPAMMSTALPRLEVAAFDAPLWLAPPPPPAPPAEAPPPPPLKVQLLGIVRDRAGVLRAVLYDPDSDTISLRASGQTLGPRTIDRVEAASVSIRDGQGVRVLALRTKGGPP